MVERTLLDETMAAARRDRQTVDASGQSLAPLIAGVQIRQLPTHLDARGSVTELFDPRWNWHADPLVFAYFFMIRPGMAKGWNLHLDHEDRYAILEGDVEVVLFDPRPDSSTCGLVNRIVMSEQARCLVNIPRQVWHADRNIGSKNALVANFPTAPYDHANPDKYRLPLNTPLIPFAFEGTQGW